MSVTVTSEDFVRTFDRHPAGVWSAPGRVNLIGEHTDYNDGFVLPFAIDARTTVAAAARDDGVVRLRSAQQPTGDVAVRVADLAPGSPEGWAAYAAGVVWAFREAGHDVPGLDLLVDGRVPLGAGLSSSAALECAVAMAVGRHPGTRPRRRPSSPCWRSGPRTTSSERRPAGWTSWRRCAAPPATRCSSTPGR